MVIASLIVLIVGYLMGCILGSNLAKSLTGVNLKETGSKNAGATNAVISLGWKYGILVVIIDIGKMISTIILVRYFLNFYHFTADEISLLLYITGAAVIIGHNFPFYMNFNGGKGTASVIGLLIMINWQLGVLSIFTFFLFAFISNYLIIGVFQLYFILIAVSFAEQSIWPKIISLSLLLIALYLHTENIQRIRNGTEPKMSLVYKKESEKSEVRTNLPN